MKNTFSYEVTCVSKAFDGDVEERITHLGGQNPEGKRWRLQLGEAIEGVLNGKWAFFITIGGVRRNLIIAVSRRGMKYLKTDLDGRGPDALLSLPECIGADWVKN